ncbi:MAG: cobalamin biosynthesis protein P47K [Chloroflexi bacterium]|uniref:GTP-binding protein n=1 Tax=Candidatus Flexifilum breve TaxID=3140694 RepID=UPI0031373F60|nr:cobalamin biosynthesis protein P47K [Chloroflexota bacterium]
MAPNRLMIVGGFLGSGKTTLLTQAAKRFVKQGYRVGLVTNDQGSNLVDTALLNKQGFPVAEVAGSCFCCAFNDLLQALTQLQNKVQPDIILAEPVGSCTDLLSTVIRPLEQLFPGQFEVAPLSVVIDASRDVRTFSPNVAYLYECQLTEAEVILLNKADLVEPDSLLERKAALQAQFPRSQVFTISAHSGFGIDDWMGFMTGRTSASLMDMEVDYARYADAEAELAWLNMQGAVRASVPFSAQEWAMDLFASLKDSLQPSSIAHIKAQIVTPVATYKVSLTQNESELTWDLTRSISR